MGLHLAAYFGLEAVVQLLFTKTPSSTRRIIIVGRRCRRLPGEGTRRSSSSCYSRQARPMLTRRTTTVGRRCYVLPGEGTNPPLNSYSTPARLRPTRRIGRVRHRCYVLPRRGTQPRLNCCSTPARLTPTSRTVRRRRYLRPVGRAVIWCLELARGGRAATARDMQGRG